MYYRANTSRLFAGSASFAEWLKSCSGWGSAWILPPLPTVLALTQFS